MVAIEAASKDIAMSVVANAAAGDIVALERIVARYHADLARVCVVVCGGDADLAEDAVQAAWLIAWRKLGQLRDPARLRPWLVSVAANEARQILRARHRERVFEIEVSDLAADRHDPASTVANVDLGLALRRLRPDDRALIALRFVAGLDSNEIGRALGLSASGVRSRLERLLIRLRSELGDD